MFWYNLLGTVQRGGGGRGLNNQSPITKIIESQATLIVNNGCETEDLALSTHRLAMRSLSGLLLQISSPRKPSLYSMGPI